MRCRLLGDEDVLGLSADAAVGAMRDAVLLAHAGRLAAPPRIRAQLDELAYVFTVGAVAGGPAGFRVYRAGAPAGDQLVAVWDAEGRLDGVIVGDELGARRTGALGAVSVDALARPEADSVAVIGSGVQAWVALWALRAVRRPASVRVHSPDGSHRTEFARRARQKLGLAAQAVDSAAEAVRGADVVIMATRSTTPVIDAADVAAGTHVVTVGPKAADGHETPLALAERAAVITCDSPGQAAAYPAPFFVDPSVLVDLGAVVSGDHPGRRSPGDVTLHCSVGLAGTEVMLARRLLDETG